MTRFNKDKVKIGVWGVFIGSVLTMLVGFAWGGWVSGNSSLKMSEEMAMNAVVERLVPICIAQFNQDPERDNKLEEFKGLSSWNRDQYVKEQGWATMPFESEPDIDVAKRCSTQILNIGL